MSATQAPTVSPEPPLAESDEAQSGECWTCGFNSPLVSVMVEHLMTHLVPA